MISGTKAQVFSQVATGVKKKTPKKPPLLASIFPFANRVLRSAQARDRRVADISQVHRCTFFDRQPSRYNTFSKVFWSFVLKLFWGHSNVELLK